MDKKELKLFIEDMSNTMTRIDAMKDVLKEGINAGAEKFEVNKKQLRKLVNIYYRQVFRDVKQENEEFEELYTEIFGE